MMNQKYIYIVICFFLWSICHEIYANEECDKSKCPGPLAYYEALGCTPIYSAEGDCCAVEYNCDYLNGRSKEKCYLRDQIYEIGERLRPEDARPCDIGCTCAMGSDGFAAFNCAVVDCFQGPPKDGCYRNNTLDSCCPGVEVCPKNPEDRPRCVVDGLEYRGGEYFTPKSDPNLSCICSEGFKGEYVLPFCKYPKPSCNPEFRNAGEIHHKCAPVYYSSQNPANACSVFSRCQNSNDTVVASGNPTTAGDSTCSFGQLKMNLGDELNSATDYSSVCVKCVCEVPPLLTCQRLPDDECEVTSAHYIR